MPNLENLRKRAKQYLRWHGAGDYTAAAQIRTVLPRYRHLNDQQVLQQSFKLSDAQELVAKQHGFDTWPALKKGIVSMSEPSTQAPREPSLLFAEPQLFVTSIPAAIEFYSTKLGFEVRLTYGEPPYWAQIGRDEVRLNMRHVDAPVFESGFRARERDALSATIVVSNARALFLEYRSRGADFHQALKTEPWGTTTFIVGDPDGNLLMFADAGRFESE